MLAQFMQPQRLEEYYFKESLYLYSQQHFSSYSIVDLQTYYRLFSYFLNNTQVQPITFSQTSLLNFCIQYMIFWTSYKDYLSWSFFISLDYSQILVSICQIFCQKRQKIFSTVYSLPFLDVLFRLERFLNEFLVMNLGGFLSSEDFISTYREV